MSTVTVSTPLKQKHLEHKQVYNNPLYFRNRVFLFRSGIPCKLKKPHFPLKSISAMTTTGNKVRHAKCRNLFANTVFFTRPTQFVVYSQSAPSCWNIPVDFCLEGSQLGHKLSE